MTEETPLPADRFLRCWSCGLRFQGGRVYRDGMLQGRSDRYGGPYYRYKCPGCAADNMCESTVRGTMFASPPFAPTIMDWLVGKFAPGSAEFFFTFAAWQEREEERRRYVFERDGDFRYSSLFQRLRWYLRSAEQEEPEPRWAPPPRIETVPTPYAILGLKPGASPRDVRRAFLRLARRYHPDKAYHLGPEHVRHAEQRFKELLAAYEKLANR